MTDTHEHPPFTVAIDNRPEIHDATDIAVIVRGPFGSYYLAVDVVGNYHLHHDPIPGIVEVPEQILADGNLYERDDHR